MVSQLILLGAAGFAAAKLLGKKGGSSKFGKIIDVTRGTISEFLIGMGAGAVINTADNKLSGGQLQSFFIGNAAKGQNLNGTDAVLALVTTGFVTKKKELTRFATILAGKKIGEFTGAIDPAELTTDVRGAGFQFNPGVRT